MVQKLLLLGWLYFFAEEDTRRRQLSLLWLSAFAGCGVLWAAKTGLGQGLAGAVVGIALSVAALASGEKIGLGDGLLFCGIGLFCGLWMSLTLLFIASLLCALFGAAGLLTKRWERKDQLPFVPFVLGAYVLLLALQG